MFHFEKKKKRRNTVIIILFYLVIIVLFIVYFSIVHEHTPISIQGVYLKAPMKIKDFQFTDNHGASFSKKNLMGHWTILFFGFTNCPMICPTTMAQLNSMYEILQEDLPKNQIPQIVFVTVDPDRDSIEKLDHFVCSFNNHFKGVRANLSETVRLERALHITVSNTNTINHSMEILLLNPQARVQAYFSFPHHGTRLAADYKSIVSDHNH